MEHETHDDDDADDEDDYDGVDNHDVNHDGNEEENTGDDGCKFLRLGNSAAGLISPPQQTMQLHTWNNIGIQMQIADT